MAATANTESAKAVTEERIDDNPGKTPLQDDQSDPTPPPLQSAEASNGDTSPDAGVSLDEESKPNSGDPATHISGSTTDTLKKKLRAERFGMPVQLSEQEKRSSRAERFGTAPGVNESDAIKKSEEHKRKARAERFGLEQTVPAAEEERKKARLARFAPVSKADPVEEDKKKARALRFSVTPTSLAQANGKGTEAKTAIPSKTGAGV